MKCFWQTCMALAALAAMVSTAGAQNNWGQPSEIGSYQSILSRAGYGADGIAGQPFSQATAQAHQMSGQVVGGQAVQGQLMPSQGQVMAGQGQVMAGQSQVMAGQGQMMSGQGQVMTGGAVMGQGVPVQGCATGGCGASGSMVGGGYGGGMVYGGNMGYGMGGGMVGGMQGAGANGLVGVPCGTNDAYIGGSYADYGYDDYSAPVYQPGRMLGGGGGGFASRLGGLGGGNANYVVGVYGLFFARDYEDRRPLSFNAAGDRLYTTDADHGTFGGFGANLTRRNCNGRGLQLGYWGFDESSSASIAGPGLRTELTGLQDVFHVPAGATVYDHFDLGDTHTITRQSEIHNFEVNRLINGGSFNTFRGRQGTFELLGGFRYFQFDESLNFASNYPGGVPENLAYNIEAENQLLGLQLGGRSEFCLSQKLRLGVGSKVGIFNNRINTRQSIADENGVFSDIYTGPHANTDYNFSAQKDDVAMLGELDLSLIFQTSQKSRFVAGYRALGISGVALAANQIPYDFTDRFEIERARANGNLLLHGGYFGLEWCR